MKRKFTDCVDIVGTSCKSFEGTKWYVSTGAIDEDCINEEDIEIIDFDSKPSRANLTVLDGDVIFAKMQATKKTLLIEDGLSEHVYSTGFCAVRAKNKVLTEKCLLYLLTSDTFLRQKDKNCSGATQKAITNLGLEKIIVNIPAYEQQGEIAEVLDRVIRIIKMRQRELKYLDDLIKSRFVEMFGSPVFNPLNWAKRTLKDVCIKLNDGTHFSPESFETGEYKYVTAKNIKLSGFDFTNISYVTEEVHRPIYERCNPEQGDVLYIKDGVTTGIAMVNTLEEEFTLLSSVALLKQDRSIINGYFLTALLNNEDMYLDIRNNMGGAAITRLTIAKLNAIKIIVPPIELQKQFADFVNQVDKLKVKVQESLNKTQLLFDSLMQEYFG